MNRSFISVIAGGFGNDVQVSSDEEQGEHRETNAEEVAELLKNASSVIITPGYGMAVAQAQYPVAEITRNCVSVVLTCVLVFTLLQVVYRVI